MDLMGPSEVKKMCFQHSLFFDKSTLKLFSWGKIKMRKFALGEMGGKVD